MKKIEKRYCKICNKEFIPITANSVYCSRECYKKSQLIYFRKYSRKKYQKRKIKDRIKRLDRIVNLFAEENITIDESVIKQCREYLEKVETKVSNVIILRLLFTYSREKCNTYISAEALRNVKKKLKLSRRLKISKLPELDIFSTTRTCSMNKKAIGMIRKFIKENPEYEKVQQPAEEIIKKKFGKVKNAIRSNSRAAVSLWLAIQNKDDIKRISRKKIGEYFNTTNQSIRNVINFLKNIKE